MKFSARRPRNPGGAVSVAAPLDAAVLAGVTQSNGADPIDTARNVFQNNVNRFANWVAADVQASFEFDGTILSGKASGVATNPFGGLIGSKTYGVSADSAAMKMTASICVLGLNGMDKGSFDQNGNSVFNAPDCAVQANTTSRSGMTQEGKPNAVAKRFAVGGGHTGSNYSTPPADNSPKIADPYASLPFPFMQEVMTAVSTVFGPPLLVRATPPSYLRRSGVFPVAEFLGVRQRRRERQFSRHRYCGRQDLGPGERHHNVNNLNPRNLPVTVPKITYGARLIN